MGNKICYSLNSSHGSLSSLHMQNSLILSPQDISQSLFYDGIRLRREVQNLIIKIQVQLGIFVSYSLITTPQLQLPFLELDPHFGV